jgi:NDP-sugar pyrophosphorylase family protein
MTEASSSIFQGGIIAAGEGTRLRADGYRVSKPMVQVGGRPLISFAIDRFRSVGIHRLTVALNETSADCQQWLYDHAGDFDLDLIVRNTPSSYATFQIVADRLAGAAAVITTVDTVMPVGDFEFFVRSASELAKDGVVLGLAENVDDENPLWATLDISSGCIRQLGGSHGSHVTAGLYCLPAQRPAEPPASFARLRDYLRWLVAEHQPIYGVVLPRVFDIDRAHDVVAAETAGLVLERGNFDA